MVRIAKRVYHDGGSEKRGWRYGVAFFSCGGIPPLYSVSTNDSSIHRLVHPRSRSPALSLSFVYMFCPFHSPTTLRDDEGAELKCKTWETAPIATHSQFVLWLATVQCARTV